MRPGNEIIEKILSVARQGKMRQENEIIEKIIEEFMK